MAKTHPRRNEKYPAGFWIIEAADLDFDESDRSQPAYQKVLESNPGGGVGSGRGVRSRVSGRRRGTPRTTGDDPRCSTWFP
jgi:hypothetical protein